MDGLPFSSVLQTSTQSAAVWKFLSQMAAHVQSQEDPFIVWLHKVLKKTFWSLYSQLYSANPILFKYYIIRFFSLDPSGFNKYSNEMGNLFCSIFWIISSLNCLNDQANNCLIHFYKRKQWEKAVSDTQIFSVYSAQPTQPSAPWWLTIWRVRGTLSPPRSRRCSREQGYLRWTPVQHSPCYVLLCKQGRIRLCYWKGLWWTGSSDIKKETLHIL